MSQKAAAKLTLNFLLFLNIQITISCFSVHSACVEKSVFVRRVRKGGVCTFGPM